MPLSVLDVQIADQNLSAVLLEMIRTEMLPLISGIEDSSCDVTTTLQRFTLLTSAM